MCRKGSLGQGDNGNGVHMNTNHLWFLFLLCLLCVWWCIWWCINLLDFIRTLLQGAREIHKERTHALLFLKGWHRDGYLANRVPPLTGSGSAQLCSKGSNPVHVTYKCTAHSLHTVG